MSEAKASSLKPRTRKILTNIRLPPLVDLLHQGGDVLDGFFLEHAKPMAFAHLLLVCRVDEVNDLARAEKRRGKEDCVLTFFGHGGSPQKFAAEEEGTPVYMRLRHLWGSSTHLSGNRVNQELTILRPRSGCYEDLHGSVVSILTGNTYGRAASVVYRIYICAMFD
jgi:hypothetical protein